MDEVTLKKAFLRFHLRVIISVLLSTHLSSPPEACDSPIRQHIIISSVFEFGTVYQILHLASYRLRKFNLLFSVIADHSGRVVYGMNCLRPLERWDRGFESHSRHGHPCAFILFVLFFV
jgi:hypothetical protein